MKSYVIQLHKKLVESEEILALVDTVNGDPVDPPFEVKLKILDSFVRKGGWAMRNACLDSGEQVVIQDKAENSYHTCLLYFENHNSGAIS